MVLTIYSLLFQVCIFYNIQLWFFFRMNTVYTMCAMLFFEGVHMRMLHCHILSLKLRLFPSL